MLFHLLYNVLGNHVSAFRIFGFTSTRILAAAITALLLSFIIGPWFIERLKSRQIGETIRTDGPATHKKKAGTPTMGGSLILFCLTLSTLLWCDLTNQFVWLALTVTVGFGAIGFVDDYQKVAKKNKAGISGKLRLALEFLIAGAAMAYLYHSDLMPADIRLRLQLPFGDFYSSDIVLPAALYFVFGMIVVVGTSNAVNLTDGLDGLAIGPVIINAATYLIFAYVTGVTIARFDLAAYLDIAPLRSTSELAVFCGAMIGSGIGFLWYNTYPAQVFMGDVGALALGGGLGMLALITKNELLSLLLGGVFVVEIFSVIVQTSVFKITRWRTGVGRRIFLMAPIHHHFEKKGWAEPKVIVRFWIISLLLALLAIGTLKMR
jgi:phospho-N-acetylmuramoyl-pentapeptide-transferase